MRNLDNYIDYFANLAEKYQIKLDFYIMDVNEFTGALRGSVQYPCMILNGLQGELKENTVDNIHDKTRAGFMIIDHCANVDDFTREREILTNTKAIAMDIISRMMYDKLERCEEYPMLREFAVSEVKYEMYGPVFDNDYGWNVTFSISEQLDLTFEPENWEDI